MTDVVYVVWHTHLVEDAARDSNEDVGNLCDDSKVLGIFTSRHAAELRIVRAQKAAGFSDAPSGFTIDEYRLDKDYWEDGYASVQP